MTHVEISEVDSKLDYISRMEDEFKDKNPIDLMTPNAVFDTIRMFDSTVEIIGYIDGIEPPRIVGNQQHKFFKFYLNNGTGRRVQVVAWNDDIQAILHHIMPYHIIHLDGVQARMPKFSNFNNGNVPYELLIRSNTFVLNLGQFESNLIMDKPIPVKLIEVVDTSGCIVLETYVKTNFAEVHDNKLNKIIGYGSVTDGVFKLEVHIVNFSYEEYMVLGINKSDKIELIGVMQAVNPPYLLVNDIYNIKKLKGYMSINSLWKGVSIPTKRKSKEDSLQEKNKKHSI